MTTWGVPPSRTKPLRLATVCWPCHRSGIGNFCWAWQALGPLRMVPFTRGAVGLWQSISWSKVEFSHKKNPLQCDFHIYTKHSRWLIFWPFFDYATWRETSFFSRSSNNPQKKDTEKSKSSKWLEGHPQSPPKATMNHWSSFTIQYSPKKWHPHAIFCWGFFGLSVAPQKPRMPVATWWSLASHTQGWRVKCFAPELTLKPVLPGSRTFFHAGSCDWNKHPNGIRFFLLLEIGDFFVQFQA